MAEAPTYTPSRLGVERNSGHQLPATGRLHLPSSSRISRFACRSRSHRACSSRSCSPRSLAKDGLTIPPAANVRAEAVASVSQKPPARQLPSLLRSSRRYSQWLQSREYCSKANTAAGKSCHFHGVYLERCAPKIKFFSFHGPPNGCTGTT